MQRRTCNSSAGPDIRLRDDSPAADSERPGFPKRLISDHDLDLVVTGMSFITIVAYTVPT
jgi:hypothetical protein